MARYALVLVTALVLAGPSSAQQLVIQSRAGGAEQAGEVRVQVNMNFFVAAPDSSPDAVVAAQESARRTLYDSASRECEVLKATLAKECRLESVNVNVNRTYGNQQPGGFNANGGFGYRITLK